MSSNNILNNTLTPLENKFVDEYMIDKNGTQAVLRAGYKTKAPGRYANKITSPSRENRRKKEVIKCQIH